MPGESHGESGPRTSAVIFCRSIASRRFSASSRFTVPSSSHPQVIAVITPGVFQVVALMARSILATHSSGEATHPTRRLVATLLENPET